MSKLKTKHHLLSADKASTLVDLLQWRVRHQPHQRAYTFLADGDTETHTWTYGDLDRQAQIIAAALQQRQIGHQPVLLFYPSGLNYHAAFLGCVYAGAIAVPAYPPRPNRPDSRLQAIAQNTQAGLILTDTDILATAEQRVSQIPALANIPWLATDQLSPDLAELWHKPTIDEDTVVFLQYTSGSTATPKGIMISHANLYHNEQMILQGSNPDENTSNVSWLPLFHDMGLVGGILQPIYLGRPCILMPPGAFLYRPIRWLKAMSRYQATVSGAPNFAYDLCVERIKPAQCQTLNLSRWQIAFNSSEVVRVDTMTRFTKMFAPYGFCEKAFYPCYGMAEATLFISGGLKTEAPLIYHVDSDALTKNKLIFHPEAKKNTKALVSCGHTWGKQKIIIVDPQTLTVCPDEHIGEVWVSGPNISRGYWANAEKTSRTFQAYLADTGEGPFLRTGDLGFLKDGNLCIAGRLKEIIIIYGRNHYPQDIELTVEQSHPALQPGQGAAFTVDINGEEKLVIIQAIKRSHLKQVDITTVRGDIRQAVMGHHQLQIYKINLVKSGKIPKTSSGKTQRHLCKTQFLNNSLDLLQP